MLWAADTKNAKTAQRSWIMAPYSLISWWDMRTFPLSEYLILVRGLQEVAVQQVEEDFEYTSDLRETDTKAFDSFEKDARKYALPFTANQFRRMADRCRTGCSHSEMVQMISEALNRIEDECRERLMLMVEPKYIDYIEDPQFFDSPGKHANRVSVQFPSAAEDIAESGICLALGRSTACVMHLSRVLEVGLQALANAVGVTKQNDWGRYLKLIDDELTNRIKAAGARTPDEQFYAEARASFDDMRRAWRNPTMHVDKVYSSARAEEILISVRSFMRHLAMKVHE